MTTLDDLPFDYPSEATPTGALGVKPCRRHHWWYGPGPFKQPEHCARCSKPRDPIVSRRGRTNASRGKRAELDVARSIPGARKMGPLGLSWDVEVGTYARLQVKKLIAKPSLAEIARLIERIPDTGDRLRGFVWVEAAGQGKHGQRIVWFLQTEFTEWHDGLLDFGDRVTLQRGLVSMTLDDWATEFVA